jgi:hypothetical protein
MIQYPAAEWTIVKYRRKTEQMSSSQKVCSQWAGAGMSRANGHKQGGVTSDPLINRVCEHSAKMAEDILPF